MPAWRKLHTKTTESLDLNELPDDFTRLLWVLLPLGLDREGRGLDNPSWVKAKLMPLRTDIALDQIAGAFDCFAACGMIQRYQVGGRSYFAVPTWRKYQGDTSREAGSSFPPPPAPDVEAGPPIPLPHKPSEQDPPLPVEATSLSAPPDRLTSGSGGAQDLYTTSSRLDSDSDSDADLDADTDSPLPPAENRPPAAIGESENCDPLSFYRQTFDLPPLTPAQERTLLALASTHGPHLLKEAIAWAAGAGIPHPRALRAIGTALPGWRTTLRNPPRNLPRRRKPIDDLIAELQKEPQEAHHGRPPRPSKNP